jgi:hypothetical protein
LPIVAYNALMEIVNLDEGIARGAVGPAHNSGVRSWRQPKDNCRVESIRRRKPVALHVASVIAILPIIVSRDNRSIGIDNC